MKPRIATYIFLPLLWASCMPEEDLPVRNVGKIPEYFIECYCKPEKPFTLTATHILDITSPMRFEYPKDMTVSIFADKKIRLNKTFDILPNSETIYNYGSTQTLAYPGIDTLYLEIITKDQKIITGKTIIPEAVSIHSHEMKENTIGINFYTSQNAEQNYYICTAELRDDYDIIEREVAYLDYSDGNYTKLVGEKLEFSFIPETGAIILTLKRITKANYDYQISLNGANAANQSSITNPVSLKGNLHGALGIFTCYTEDQKIISFP